MKKYHIITYGCQMNEHDSESIAGLLEYMNYVYSEDPKDADVVVMNTCSIRENADKRFFGVLGQFKKKKRENREFIICVCGCMPQQTHIVEKIKKQFSWVDIIFGTQNIGQFPELLERRLKTGKKQYDIIANNPDLEESKIKPKRLYKHKAFVNIVFGCNNFCTYCVVPYTRGREKSRELEKIISEIKYLAKDGVKEVMLLGQNVDSYKDIKENDFADLLQAVNDVKGIERIRFMTSHPKDISDKMIDCFASCHKLCKSIHLPIQSGSDTILKRMNRHYDSSKYLKIIEKLRKTAPDIAISTDIIVGFPGETEDDFQKTLDIVEKVRYDSAFTFIYSPRKGTPAAKFTDRISEDVIRERFNRLIESVNRISLEKNQKYLGKEYDIIVEGLSKNDESRYAGRTDDFKLVNFTSDKSLNEIKGETVKVLITDCKTFSLEGKAV
ncbi:MAG TPA: tRNA (N6-isopentenyl adenosine(37)-C2)-methylthiotransferase MiaB [Mogibacterium sp.]|nr:tRNA (N6-isopentenyl adenosine(37)-C2)-methylthiotransferase MiaB [Mogibacterium sp.]